MAEKVGMARGGNPERYRGSLGIHYYYFNVRIIFLITHVLTARH